MNPTLKSLLETVEVWLTSTSNLDKRKQNGKIWRVGFPIRLHDANYQDVIVDQPPSLS